MKQWYSIPNGLNRNQAFEGREYALKKLIEFRCYPLDMILDKLLIDKTTGKRIIWATDGYSEYGDKYCDRYEITPGTLAGINPVLIQPRAFKALETQQQRTKSKAEVFTPPWIVNKMISHLDEEWFGRPGVFNMENGQAWATNTDQIDFEDHKWQDYVDRSVLEITCGEAPFIVSRYNASTGEIIPIEDRIGVLDRKLRVVTENTDNEEDWIKWAKRAYESVYGYEYQGDNLLIGRINLLMTFLDYYQSAWKKEADQSLLSAITNIITWNFWQMDGLNGTVPLGVPQPVFEQMTLFDIEEEPEEKAPLCKVRKWRAKKTILYKENEMKEGNDMGKKKWDIVLGNPPYQIETESDSTRALPVYNDFMDAAEKIGDIVELITPARFLFDAGFTPKIWNKKKLNDRHFKVLMYEPDPRKIFPSADIKGGVAITLRDSNRDFDPIKVFTKFPQLNRILSKVEKISCQSMESQMYSPLSIQLSEQFKLEFPDSLHRLRSSAFDKLPEVFQKQRQSDLDIKMYGLAKGEGRTERFINPRYIVDSSDTLDKFTLLIPKASGSGVYGETLADSIICAPGEGFTQTFNAFGKFDSRIQTANAAKYIRTKTARALLGILKITQDCPAPKWKYVPLQDFTSNSDIDWSKSIPEIDQQLYKKYNLSPEEIEFIETHVKEME